jgi:hypothetical protein
MKTRSIALAVVITGLVPLWTQPASSHKQPVHQYIVHEGYLLLLQKYPQLGLTALAAHIGEADKSFAGDSAWQKPYVTTGAWREDEEDVIFRYDFYGIAGIRYPLVSITHFWPADNGDFTKTPIRLEISRSPLPPLSVDLPPFENAYDKITRFRDGGWVLYYPRPVICQNVANGHILVVYPPALPAGTGFPISYAGLAGFYTTRVCSLRPEALSAFVIFDVNDVKQVDPGSVSAIKVPDDVRDHIVWEILGRMCHLLGDMNVPAHAHNDEHGLNPDSYEEYMGGAATPYTVWDHTNAGGVIDPYVSDDPLHFLMYVTQEQADHFGSNGPAGGTGNDIIGGNPRPSEISYLNAVNVGTLGLPTTGAGPWTADYLNNIRDHTFPGVIRATAGLLQWFCTETGLLPLTSLRDDGQAGSGLPPTVQLEQNFPNPFNPTTTIRYALPGRMHVRIAVWNTVGEKVATLADGIQEQGEHEVKFDGTGLAGGVYFSTLKAGGYSRTRRIVLLK